MEHLLKISWKHIPAWLQSTSWSQELQDSAPICKARGYDPTRNLPQKFVRSICHHVWNSSQDSSAWELHIVLDCLHLNQYETLSPLIRNLQLFRNYKSLSVVSLRRGRAVRFVCTMCRRRAAALLDGLWQWPRQFGSIRSSRLSAQRGLTQPQSSAKSESGHRCGQGRETKSRQFWCVAKARPIHTGHEHANLRAIPLMLLVSSVNTHSQQQVSFACICASRPVWMKKALRVWWPAQPKKRTTQLKAFGLLLFLAYQRPMAFCIYNQETNSAVLLSHLQEKRHEVRNQATQWNGKTRVDVNSQIWKILSGNPRQTGQNADIWTSRKWQPLLFISFSLLRPLRSQLAQRLALSLAGSGKRERHTSLLIST